MLRPIPTYLSLSDLTLQGVHAFCPKCQNETPVTEGRLECCGFAAGDIFAAPKKTSHIPGITIETKTRKPRRKTRTHHEPRKVPTIRVPKFVKPCEECGERMEVFREHKRFCSTHCRNAAHDLDTNPRLSRLVTVADLAMLSGVSAATIRRKIKKGEIVAHKVGHIYLVSKSTLKQNPVPTAVAPPAFISPEVADAFRSFAHENSLSVRKLADTCGIGKSSAHRLLAGTADEDYFHKILPTLPPEITSRIRAT